MLIQPQQRESTRAPYQTQRLWHDSGRFTPSLGCSGCPDRAICGGLTVESAIFDCLRFCCQNATDCDAVCRNKPEEFAQRVREIGGFDLGNVPRGPMLVAPRMPVAVPIVFHASKRSLAFSGPGVICLPLYKLVEARTGRVRFTGPRQLRDEFGLKPDVRIILTGTSTDPALERWWSFASRRIEAIRALKELGVCLVTTPNYSLFTDQPRWDDLHSMKRIALVHQEFLEAGIPAALHVNARTEHDWERWGEFISFRPEITHVAFEFATGAGWAGRLDWYAERLSALCAAVPRPLRLVMRGGFTILQRMVAIFEEVTCLETSAFVKTMHRKAAIVRPGGAVRWRHAPTEQNEPLDALMDHNWRVVSESYARILSAASAPRKAA